MATINIVGGNIAALIHGGQSQLSCVDGVGTPVTADSFTTSDGTKVTVTNAGLLQGMAESGSATITPVKAGYTSVAITVTCSGGSSWIFDPNTDSHTNGQNSTTNTDNLGNVWTATGTPPTVFVNASTGRKCYLFGGAGYFYCSTDPTPFPSANVSVFSIAKATVDSTWMNIIDYAGASHGWWLGRSNTNTLVAEVATGYTPVSGGTLNIAAGWKPVGFTSTPTAQVVYINGSSIATGTQTYTPGISGIPGAVIGIDSLAEYMNGAIGLSLAYNRVINSTELAQVTLRLQNEITALTATGAHSLTGAVTTAVTPAATMLRTRHRTITGAITTTPTPAATFVHQKHPSKTGAVTTAVTPSATKVYQHHRLIAGAVTTSVTPSATKVYQRHRSLTGGVTTAVTPSATKVYNHHRSIVGGITSAVTPAGVLQYRHHRTIAGAASTQVTPSATMAFHSAGQFAGHVTTAVTPAATMKVTRRRSFAGSVTVGVSPHAALSFHYHRIFSGAVTVAARPSATMIFRSLQSVPTPILFALPNFPSLRSSL